MALTGTLESIPLPEVLRMLARSRKSGCLRIDAGGLQGKVYLTEGWMTYATTRRDQDLRADLMSAGMVDEAGWKHVERRERGIAEVLTDGFAREDLTRFISEQITDVLFRLSRPGHGTFDFGEDVGPHYPTEQQINIEVCLDEAEKRIAQWRLIEEVIPGVNFRLRMVHVLPEEAREVTITVDTWRLLSALNGQGTVEEVAARLGSTDFQIAQVMAQMVRQGLLEVVDQLAPARYSYGEGEAAVEEAESSHPSDEETPDEITILRPGDDSAAAEEEVDADPDVDDDAELLQSVLSGFSGETENESSEGTERTLGRRRGLGALARELSDLTE
ncbi:MAG: DUF4388 domain-containing protein [Acidimicrobiia bacterium]|nr:DUF4388 domain-containing protein [Acidimicrobiia bacterium]